MAAKKEIEMNYAGTIHPCEGERHKFDLRKKVTLQNGVVMWIPPIYIRERSDTVEIRTILGSRTFAKHYAEVSHN